MDHEYSLIIDVPMSKQTINEEIRSLDPKEKYGSRSAQRWAGKTVGRGEYASSDRVISMRPSVATLS